MVKAASGEKGSELALGGIGDFWHRPALLCYLFVDPIEMCLVNLPIQWTSILANLQ